MPQNKMWRVLAVAAVVVMLAAACAPAATPTQAPATQAPAPTQPPAAATEAPATEAPMAPPPVLGLVLVGPYNDHGWSQAHYDGAQYVVDSLPGFKFVYIDKANSADRPGTTPDQLAESLLAQGANVIDFSSDDMKDAANTFAQNHPDIPVIMASGDQQWQDGKDYKGFPNMTNTMGKMIYGKMIAGCAAALTTTTGQIGYLGPLINDETRRLASSVYLGAKYCWTNYLGKDAASLQFKVTWIGFWFNIPGFTSDPTQVADDFFNSGYDVVVSGIDTTEALAEANKYAGQGQQVWAVSYDYKDGCAEAPSVCLGVPYFNWGPSYLKVLKSVQDGTFQPEFAWNPPDWSDINNPDTSAVGFAKGEGLSADASSTLDKFIGELGSGLNLWTGPVNLQDGTAYLQDGETATDQQVWYLPQLLEGMEGQSVPSQ
jgi:simple sugar transport system substrate-binding protein